MSYSGEAEMIRQLSEFDEVMADWGRYREQVSLRDVLENRDARNMVLYTILVTIQAAIQAAHHLIVKNYLPKPGTYEETFIILRKAGILAPQMADGMAQLSTYRSKLVYSYHQVDLREIYEVLCGEFKALEHYRAKVEKVMKEETK